MGFTALNIKTGNICEKDIEGKLSIKEIIAKYE
jgi:hypothetical protein